jgi:hypothetical protein
MIEGYFPHGWGMCLQVWPIYRSVFKPFIPSVETVETQKWYVFTVVIYNR